MCKKLNAVIFLLFTLLLFSCSTNDDSLEIEELTKEEAAYDIVVKYAYDGYPSNPNGSDYNTAMMCSKDGRHLVMMPHIERSIFQWNWANYLQGRKDDVSPWLEAFVNARNWLVKK